MKQRGFTLLEIILVLALIGGIASVILPNLNVTIDSQMSTSIRNFSSAIRSAYDNAVFSGRVQRMVIDIRKGAFWVEQAPPGFNGRPPLFDNDKNTLQESSKKRLLESLEEKAKNGDHRASPYSSEDNPIFYTLRSIPVVQKKILIPAKWIEVSDGVISKKSLLGSVVVAKFISGLSTTSLEYASVAQSTDSKETKYGYIYFLPNGTATPTSIQLGIKNSDNMISEDGLKYTLNLNTLTGVTNLLEGFQDANFKLPKK
ncbi:MAG: type II secretion system protein [Bdellovibrionota bacterium]